jgi:hypothetical protein
MPSPVSPTFPYDLEWVESLIGILMTVPEYWCWLRYSRLNLCHGKIVSIGTTVHELNCFVLVLTDEPGRWYGIWHDAVLLYSDKNKETTSQFHLLSNLPDNPAHKRLVTVTVLCVGVCVESCA